ncbi:hypothetical protein HYDPIDRAFT_110117 [Hydnomerulius pinastri MD-312]|nr:hypothetical protein HYDPIDRAFT_110117 [Hydnomerulius pinastri MD-312]
MASLRQWSTLLANSACRRSMRTPATFVGHSNGLSRARQMSVLNTILRRFEGPSQFIRMPNGIPFYELPKEPLSMRLSGLFLLMDALFTCTGAGLVWFYWTKRVEGSGDSDENSPAEYELRPFNQRLAFSCLHLGVGTLVAIRLLGQRRSHIKKMWIYPACVPAKWRAATVLPPLDRVVLQTYSWSKPLLEYTLERGAYKFAGYKEDAIVRLSPPGEQREGFYLLTKGVIVNGQPVSRQEALRIILNPFKLLKEPSTAKAKPQPKKKR